MADLIIRGMEMPKNWYECPMNSFGICNVATDGENCECYDVRPDWCPLVPISEGHGRLIDADALIKEIDDRSMSDSDWWYEDRIDEMPTIVPAEGGTSE